MRNTIIALTPTADHSAKRGYFVKDSSGSAALSAAATDIPIGVILDGEPTTGKDGVQMCEGAVEPCKVKTSGAVAAFAYGVLHTDGSVVTDPGSGSRVQVCRFLEDGVSGELVEAILVKPVSLS